MTRANPLVVDGGEVKLRLLAERTAHKTPVHVDWVRFTCLLRNVPLPAVDLLFPTKPIDNIWEQRDYENTQRVNKVLAEIATSEEFCASAQAFELASDVCKALGDCFTVNAERKKGHDFYRFRWSIERNGSECGWVGFLSSGDSPKQQAQAQTIHANLYGAACTFAAHGWNHRIADIIDSHEAKLTRADLALDFFDGFGRDMDSIKEDYESGAMNSGGKKLKCNMVGNWTKNGDSRSFYIGSKEAGKQTNIYEKGDQLYGPDCGSEWMRIELRYGNKLRVLSSDMLRRPADFFAGASDWHSLQLLKASQFNTPEKVATKARLAIETVQAEVSRNIRWAFNTAAPTIAAAFQFLGSEFLELVTNQKLPGRLKKFNEAELAGVFRDAFKTVERSSPAFA